MVGLKLWGTAQKAQPTTSTSTKQGKAYDRTAKGAEERTSENIEKGSGKLNEMDPRPEEEVNLPSKPTNEMKDKTSVKAEPKEDGPRDSNISVEKEEQTELHGDAKQDTAKESIEPAQQETHKEEVVEAVAPTTTETITDTPRTAPETQTPLETTKMESVAEEERKATQDISADDQAAVDEKTEQMIKQDEANFHDTQDEPSQEVEGTGNQEPVLSEEDERFLHQVATEAEIPPPLPSRRATIIADDGEMTEEEIAEEASKISLPSTPREEKKEAAVQGPAPKPQTWKDRWGQWAVVPMPTSGVSFATPNLLRGYNYMRKQNPENASKKTVDVTESKNKDRTLAAADLKSAAAEIKAEFEKPETTDPETKATVDKNSQDVSTILSSLNLSAINNRVVGISGDTQKLLESFNTVLKDIINGGPRAYEDLEKLLTEREPQLNKLFGTLPPFLQSLVKSMPIKMYAALAPQVAAAMTLERNGGIANAMGTASLDTAETSDGEELLSATDKQKSAAKKKKSKSLIPSLRSLVGEQGAVAAMLKSILSFLEMRFPALAFLTGANVLMSLSVFILLFVFYYCHKRGRETRLKRLTAADSTDVSETTEHSKDPMAFKSSTPNPDIPESKAEAIYPSLADLESGAIFEKQDFDPRAKETVKEAAEVPLPRGVGAKEEADGKVAELMREAEGGV